MQGSQEPARRADHQPLPSRALPPHQQTTIVWRVPPPHRQPAPGPRQQPDPTPSTPGSCAPGPRWRPDPTPGAPGCYAPSINLAPHHEVSLQHYPVTTVGLPPGRAPVADLQGTRLTDQATRRL
jgi:hypothetical protein